MRRSERRKYRRRILWGRVIAAIAIVFIAIWGGYHLVGYMVKHRFFLKEEKAVKEMPIEKASIEEKRAEVSKKLIYLYLPDSQYAKLVEGTREIVESSIEEMVKDLFKILSESRERVIPQGVELKHVFVGKGVLFLDFSSEIIKNHPGGSNAELMTIYSIVNSVCKSFPEIRMVQFLVDGKVLDTLKGHVDISLPLEPIWKF
ncbi:MAG: GerMN domain-containing protein [Synergistetes bacterium]|nr:GerMN domain-containing protein [Synergistota bacterium]MCX8127793.1 GerMN domain-containing protein [Synergistota bacterium]MDW8192055.1 GerMN domain-containing protein [Synergistota bacterium]